MQVNTVIRNCKIVSPTGIITAGIAVKDGKTGKRKEFTAQRILIAVGRKSNADLLEVENTGVEKVRLENCSCGFANTSL